MKAHLVACLLGGRYRKSRAGLARIVEHENLAAKVALNDRFEQDARRLARVKEVVAHDEVDARDLEFEFAEYFVWH